MVEGLHGHRADELEAGEALLVGEGANGVKMLGDEGVEGRFGVHEVGSWCGTVPAAHPLYFGGA